MLSLFLLSPIYGLLTTDHCHLCQLFFTYFSRWDLGGCIDKVNNIRARIMRVR